LPVPDAAPHFSRNVQGGSVVEVDGDVVVEVVVAVVSVLVVVVTDVAGVVLVVSLVVVVEVVGASVVANGR